MRSQYNRKRHGQKAMPSSVTGSRECTKSSGKKCLGSNGSGYPFRYARGVVPWNFRNCLEK